MDTISPSGFFASTSTAGCLSGMQTHNEVPVGMQPHNGGFYGSMEQVRRVPDVAKGKFNSNSEKEDSDSDSDSDGGTSESSDPGNGAKSEPKKKCNRWLLFVILAAVHLLLGGIVTGVILKSKACGCSGSQQKKGGNTSIDAIDTKPSDNPGTIANQITPVSAGQGPQGSEAATVSEKFRSPADQITPVLAGQPKKALDVIDKELLDGDNGAFNNSVAHSAFWEAKNKIEEILIKASSETSLKLNADRLKGLPSEKSATVSAIVVSVLQSIESISPKPTNFPQAIEGVHKVVLGVRSARMHLGGQVGVAEGTLRGTFGFGTVENAEIMDILQSTVGFMSSDIETPSSANWTVREVNILLLHLKKLEEETVKCLNVLRVIPIKHPALESTRSIWDPRDWIKATRNQRA